MSADHWCKGCVTSSLCVRDLNADELGVLGWLADRYRRGALDYGPLNIATDSRDFILEADMEDGDKLFYLGSEAKRILLGLAARKRSSR